MDTRHGFKLRKKGIKTRMTKSKVVVQDIVIVQIRRKAVTMISNLKTYRDKVS